MIDRINLWTGALIARIQREEGQAMVEYGLILALVSVVGVVALGLIGTDVNSAFNKIADALPTTPSKSATCFPGAPAAAPGGRPPTPRWSSPYSPVFSAGS